jgi:acyl carrier protein
MCRAILKTEETRSVPNPAANANNNVAGDHIAAKVRQILHEHGRLGADVQTLSISDDLYAAGLTSHANVNVMLALESAFDVEFPDEMLKRGTFDSIGSIRRAIASLLIAA